MTTQTIQQPIETKPKAKRGRKAKATVDNKTQKVDNSAADTLTPEAILQEIRRLQRLLPSDLMAAGTTEAIAPLPPPKPEDMPNPLAPKPVIEPPKPQAIEVKNLPESMETVVTPPALVGILPTTPPIVSLTPVIPPAPTPQPQPQGQVFKTWGANQAPTQIPRPEPQQKLARTTWMANFNQKISRNVVPPGGWAVRIGNVDIVGATFDELVHNVTNHGKNNNLNLGDVVSLVEQQILTVNPQLRMK